MQQVDEKELSTPPSADLPSAHAVERKIPWWVWLVIGASILVFVGFFLTFAAAVTGGGAEGG